MHTHLLTQTEAVRLIIFHTHKQIRQLQPAGRRSNRNWGDLVPFFLTGIPLHIRRLICVISSISTSTTTTKLSSIFVLIGRLNTAPAVNCLKAYLSSFISMIKDDTLVFVFGGIMLYRAVSHLAACHAHFFSRMSE